MQINKSKAGIVILDKVDFRAQKFTRGSEGHHIMKGSIHQEDISVFDAYPLNNTAAKYTKQILIELKEEIVKFTIIVRNLNIILSTTDITTRQKKASI